jgi:hypothetical protein
VLPNAPIPFGYIDKTTGFFPCIYPGITASVPKDTIPYTTQRYRDKMAKKVEAGGFKRKYKKKTNVVLCKRCGKDKKSPTHTQYFGNVYCQETATVSLEEWKIDLIVTKGYGQKKQKPGTPPPDTE